MLIWIIKMSALTLGLSYATPLSPCQKIQHTQLTSLNERMNQMIEALYSSSILSKPKSDSSESSGHDYTPTPHYETPAYSPSYLSTPPPQVIYVAPPAVPTLAYVPPVPYPPTIPSATPYYTPEPIPPPEYQRTIRYSWPPSTYSYEHIYPQLPQAQVNPPPTVYPPQYPPQPHPKPYEYMYKYPTEYPPSPAPYAPRPQPPLPHYAPVAEYAPSHPPFARYSELIPTPPKYI